jgi:hypothetical protein
MATDRDSSEAIRALDGSVIDGHKITVERARTKEEPRGTFLECIR